MSYASTQQEILGAKPRSDRCRELTRRSDDLLERLESLNLAKYGSLKAWSNLEACRLTHDLASAINALAIEVGLSARRLRDTRSALDFVWAIQARLFGTDDEEEEEDQPCDS